MSAATDLPDQRTIPLLSKRRSSFRTAKVLSLTSLVPALTTIVVTSIWLLSRCYNGIVHDSRIYIGRALADLDPNGLGREMLFAMDGQTKLSMYSKLIEPLVRAMGPSAASMSLAFVSLALWLAAAAWLVTQLMPQRFRAAALVCAAVMPASYGPFDIFTFGESLATPRGLAEACVMAALAALLSQRRLVCAGLLIVAAIFHPAMAAPGIGVAFLVLAIEDARWWVVAPLALTALFSLALLHLGPAKTLFTAMDLPWRRIMEVRNGFLFVSRWPFDAWSDGILSLSTVVIAATLQPRGQVRTILLCTAAVALGGVATALLFGDLLSSTLVLQLQPWRTLWLGKVVAVLMIPFCAHRLWSLDRDDARLALILLGFCWCTLRGAGLAAPLAGAALGLCLFPALGARNRITRPVLVVGASGLAAVTALVFARQLLCLTTIVHALLRAGATPRLSTLLALNLQTVPVAIVAIGLTIHPLRLSAYKRALAVSALAAALVPMTLISWDQRKPTRRVVDLSQSSVALNRMIGPDRRGVVWLADDVAPWFLLSRETWVNNLQGTVGAFSRPLAMAWDARVTALIDSGLGNRFDRNPWDASPSVPTRHPVEVRDGAIRLCATRNGPDAIIAPGDLSRAFAPETATIWTSPVSDIAIDPTAKRLTFTLLDEYTVIRCDRTLSPLHVQRALTAGA